jgi:hypothetical protein
MKEESAGPGPAASGGETSVIAVSDQTANPGG